MEVGCSQFTARVRGYRHRVRHRSGFQGDTVLCVLGGDGGHSPSPSPLPSSSSLHGLCFYVVSISQSLVRFSRWLGQPNIFQADIRLRPHCAAGGLAESRNVSAVELYANPPLVQPFTRTDFFRRDFRFSVPPVWNSLPQTVLVCDSMVLNPDFIFYQHRLSLNIDPTCRQRL